jgi:hypothetical protein
LGRWQDTFEQQKKKIHSFFFFAEGVFYISVDNHLFSVSILIRRHRNGNQSLNIRPKLRYLRLIALRPNFWSLYEWEFATHNPEMQNSVFLQLITNEPLEKQIF